ncbi:OmpA family protein [Aliiglaciecola sp. LCG003]|uniref:OmpA family protein n=1 Tax=Aliiglaciecola sp. LCG003 TaxID=3053655 RepID=UPI0025736C44|nr:OmpA family protein [Aliiglaciecola sp. LCG003]WJG09801.1 OmpA family protein [Aliiglaciecola sp. LCG003]
MPDEPHSMAAGTDSADLIKLRSIILGEDHEHIKQVLNDNAREMVSEVVIEALRDRQKQDDGLSQVLTPIVEKSVQHSVNTHSEQFVGYLYPLVGRLVRKSVTAFLGEFLAKTNELIENSLTPKGLLWRLKAWQAGVSFSQYVATQTFIFRVEQVLLIHRKTGILLHSVARSKQESSDADLVSSMLTAINDFVADSFSPQKIEHEQNLQVIKTDDFSLVIKRGPRLLLVAAVAGNIPQDISTKFQKTNENIHKLYAREIAEFDGDTLPFESTEQQLQECLLVEMRPGMDKKRKKPWLAITLVSLILIACGYLGWLSYQQSKLLDKVHRLDKEPGIIVTRINPSGWFNIQLAVLRDPETISIQDWLQQQNIATQRVLVTEKHYLSLEHSMLAKRLGSLIEQYPDISLTWQGSVPQLQGKLAIADRQRLAAKLAALSGLANPSELVEKIEISELNTVSEDNPEILRTLFDINMARIERTQVEFEQGKSDLDALGKENLRTVASYLRRAMDLAKKLELNVGLIIMGASDSSGSPQYNQALSRKRALSAQAFLIEQGIEAGYLSAIGLGVVEIEASRSDVRKVIFKVVNFSTEQ